MKNLEIECKLDANVPRAFARVRNFLKQINPALQMQKLHIQDVYLDDIARSLSAQKIALRVRNTDGKWEATFKTRTEIKNGKAVRREETLPLPRVVNLARALNKLKQLKSWEGILLTNLQPRFSILNNRGIFRLTYDGALLEVALDNFTILVAGRQLKMKEIEVELKRGNPRTLDSFIQTLKQQTGLKTTQISKVKTAEYFLNLFEK